MVDAQFIKNKWLKMKAGETNRSLLFFFVFVCMMLFGGGVFQFLMIDRGHLIPKLFYYVRPFFIAVTLVLLFVPLMILCAKHMNVLDYPTTRKLQKQPVPLLGGLAIFLGILFTSVVHKPWTPQMQSIMAGSSLLLIIGTIDDIYPLSSFVRLLAQLAASAIVMSSGLMISCLPETPVGLLVGGVITIVWILGITNALNFSDGIDGLAAGITIIAAVFFFLITLQLKQYHVAMLCIILVGSCLGFFVYNFRRARIYLGDGGSTYLGFLLACIALYGGWSSRGFISALGIPGLILGVLIYDMCYITFSRIKNGLIHNVKEWLDYAGKDHFHHRLMHLGFTEEYAVVFICTICVILGLSALVVAYVKTSMPVMVLMLQGGLIFTNITMIMIIGRRLYVPKKVAEDVLENSGTLHNEQSEYISVNKLKKLIQDEEQVHNGTHMETVDDLLSMERSNGQVNFQFVTESE